MNREKVNKITTFIAGLLGLIVISIYGLVSILLFEGFEEFTLIGIALVALYACIHAYK